MRNIIDIDNPATAEWDRPLTRAEYNKVSMGFSPQDMDDKWVIFADEKDAEGNMSIRIARSWTGRELFRLEIRVQPSGGTESDIFAKIVKFTWQRSEGYAGTEEEASEIATHMYKGLLRRPLWEDADPA